MSRQAPAAMSDASERAAAAAEEAAEAAQKVAGSAAQSAALRGTPPTAASRLCTSIPKPRGPAGTRPKLFRLCATLALAAVLLVMPARAEVDAGTAEIECQIIRVLPDSRLRVSFGGQEENAALSGVQSAPPRVRYLERVALAATRPRKPARCRIVSRAPWVLSIWVYGWQDKSGDVWLDLASLLLNEGAARADPREPWALELERKAEHTRDGGSAGKAAKGGAPALPRSASEAQPPRP